MKKKGLIVSIVSAVSLCVLGYLLETAFTGLTEVTWDWVMISNVISDILAGPAIVGGIVLMAGAVFWLDGELDNKKIFKAGIVVVIGVFILSLITTIPRIPQLTVKANIHRVKMKCFDLKTNKDINIIVKRLEGAEAID